MAVIRITSKQIEEANKAREAALEKHPEFRLHEEQLERLLREAAAARDRAAASREKEQPS